jgi:hypothetical protein
LTRTQIILSTFAGFICIILFTSCSDHKANGGTKKYHLNDPSYLVTLLDNSSDLEGQSLGIEGRANESYKIFKRFTAASNDTTLLRLAKHDNPKIRVYSMWALTKKNRRLALRLMDDFKNDTAIIVYRTGCTSLPERVSWLTASQFDTTEVIMLPKIESSHLEYDIVIK